MRCSEYCFRFSLPALANGRTAVFPVCEKNGRQRVHPLGNRFRFATATFSEQVCFTGSGKTGNYCFKMQMERSARLGRGCFRMKILSLTPPLLQPNTPYPATPMLTAWLRSQGHAAVQADLSLELLLMLFSTEGLTQLFQTLEPTASGRRFLEQADAYLETIEPVVAFLQGKTSSLNVALPEGPHLQRAYEQEEQLGWNFRGLDDEDRARHLCSLYLDDVAEAYKLADPHFGFSRYAEHLKPDFP